MIVHWAWPATGLCKKVAAPATTLVVREAETNPAPQSSQDGLYQEAAETYGAALERLARAYEADAEIRRDLVQEIHIALWRSFAGFDARCSLRTWVYRVAHNAATSHVIRQRRVNSRTLVSLEEVDAASIAEITGISPGNVATKIHRIKSILARQFHQGGQHAE